MMFPRVPFNFFSKASKILPCLKSHYGTHVVKMYLLFWQLKIFKVNTFKSLGIFYGIRHPSYEVIFMKNFPNLTFIILIDYRMIQ